MNPFKQQAKPKSLTITRRGFLKALGRILLGYGVLGLTGYGYGFWLEPHWLKVERVTIPLKGLPPSWQGIRMVCLSDFHLYPYIEIDFVREVVTKANQLAPDLVLLVGDYVLKDAEAIFELAPVLADLEARHGVWCALGNHDLWTDAEMVRSGLEAVGLPVLVNQGVALEIDQGIVYLAGLDDGWSGQPDLDATLEDAPEGAPVILMLHEPDLADEIALDGRVALQISGHSHGGQVRLPGIGALILPDYAKKYDQGLYHLDGLTLYTTRGVGTIGPPVRFNCRPEITEITLVEQI